MEAENGEEVSTGTTEEVQEQVQEQPQEQSTEAPQETETDEVEYIADPILEQEEMRKMFVGGVSPESTDDELKEFFEKISGGKVVDKVIIRKETEKKNHFGFITFETSELVDEILLKRDELKFKDRMLDVNRAVPKNNQTPGAHEKTKKLFIANLPKYDCSEEQLRKYFDARHPKKYGTIESIQLIKKKDDQGNKLEENKGYGFIMVSSEDLADKMAIQHATFEFGGRRIELKKSVPNSDSKGGGRGGSRGRGRGGSSVNQSTGFHNYYNSGPTAYGPSPYSANDWSGYGYNGGYYDSYYGYGGGYGQAPAPARGGGGGRGGRYRPY